MRKHIITNVAAVGRHMWADYMSKLMAYVTTYQHYT